jgi:hypothetical protein
MSRRGGVPEFALQAHTDRGLSGQSDSFFSSIRGLSLQGWKLTFLLTGEMMILSFLEIINLTLNPPHPMIAHRVQFKAIAYPSIFLLSFMTCGQKKSETNDVDSATTDNRIEVTDMPEERKVEIKIDGSLFTAYIYPENIAKPVLYPLITSSGKTLTRGYPIAPRAFERIDHPHHVGYWLNYGDVNGLDFWGNSEARPEEDRDRLGSIVHRKVDGIEQKAETGVLKTSADWVGPDQSVLLEEKTDYVFTIDGPTRVIDRITTLTAGENEVSFKDTKEGMLGVRVIRALELESDSPVRLTDANGKPVEQREVNNEGVTGNYLSSEGLEGGGVWGTRARWMKLYGNLEGENISLTIIDHPDNVGYPTYWHARGYGLFAANPFGQHTFSEGRETLNFKLDPGQSVTLKYRLLVHAGPVLSADQLNAQADQFGSLYR